MDSDRPKGIIDGFQDDFDEIVEEFRRVCPELKLVEFFKYWNDTSMDCLFANRFDPRELLEAISTTNETLVKIIVDSNDRNDEYRIIALYFILCLFVKQPNRFRRKIRLNCGDLICIQKLSTTKIHGDIETDASFAWRQLRMLKAIDLVEERPVYGPSMLIKAAKLKSEFNPEQSDVSAESRDAREFIEYQLEPALNEIESICGPYEQIKSALQLDNYNDTTVEIQTSGTMKEFMDRCKLLLFLFKTEYS